MKIQPKRLLKIILITIIVYVVTLCLLATAFLLIASNDKEIYRCSLLNQCYTQKSYQCPPGGKTLAEVNGQLLEFGCMTREPGPIPEPLHRKMLIILVSPLIAFDEIISI